LSVFVRFRAPFTLGLAISRDLVELMHGKIAHNSAPSAGSRVELPFAYFRRSSSAIEGDELRLIARWASYR
jgi:K+-sensing histidine kinase KdpD